MWKRPSYLKTTSHAVVLLLFHKPLPAGNIQAHNHTSVAFLIPFRQRTMSKLTTTLAHHVAVSMPPVMAQTPKLTKCTPVFLLGCCLNAFTGGQHPSSLHIHQCYCFNVIWRRMFLQLPPTHPGRSSALNELSRTILVPRIFTCLSYFLLPLVRDLYRSLLYLCIYGVLRVVGTRSTRLDSIWPHPRSQR
jgi:hypothetical protein